MSSADRDNLGWDADQLAVWFDNARPLEPARV